MQKPHTILSRFRIQYLFLLGGTALLALLLLFRLGSLTYGNAAPIEATTAAAALDWHTILANPLNAPYLVVKLLVRLSGHDGITSLRLISVVFAGLAAMLFYLVARGWHNTRVALLATWLFVSSGWFLHVARLGSPEILWIVSILAIVVLLSPNRNGRQTWLALPSTLAILSIVLYVPGMVWLVLAGLLLRRKNIAEAWTATKVLWLRIVSVLFSIILLIPLVRALTLQPSLILHWLGLPGSSSLSDVSISSVGHNIVNVPLGLLLHSEFDAAHWLGTLPLLSSFEIAMLALGVYFYATHMRAARTRLIVALAVVAVLLAGIIGVLGISLIVPVVYLLLAAGIAYILRLWLQVFPNNPVARSIGILVILFAVLLTSIYQTRSYFVAWRYSPETSRAFQIKL